MKPKNDDKTTAYDDTWYVLLLTWLHEKGTFLYVLEGFLFVIIVAFHLTLLSDLRAQE